MDVKIVKGSSPDRITASLTGRVSKKFSDNVQLKLTRSGGVITVESIENSGFSFGINILDVGLKIELPQRQFDSISTDINSGDIELSQVEGGLALDTASGDIKAELQELAQPFSASTLSGNITVLTDKAPTSATVQYSILSGNFRNDWSGEEETDGGGERTVKFGAGEVPVNLSTASGDISLQAK